MISKNHRRLVLACLMGFWFCNVSCYADESYDSAANGFISWYGTWQKLAAPKPFLHHPDYPSYTPPSSDHWSERSDSYKSSEYWTDSEGIIAPLPEEAPLTIKAPIKPSREKTSSINVPHDLPSTDVDFSIAARIALILDKDLSFWQDTSANETITAFHCKDRPDDLSLSYYLRRLKQYTNISDEALVLGMFYLRRITLWTSTTRKYRKTVPQGVVFTPYTAHRLLLACMLVAAKFHDDEHQSNRTWAKAGGLALHELNKLEVEILFRLQFNLSLKRKTFKKAKQALIAQADALSSIS